MAADVGLKTIFQTWPDLVVSEACRRRIIGSMRLTIDVPEAEAEQLVRLAKQDGRFPRQQARVLLLQLLRPPAEPTDSTAAPDPTPDPLAA